MPAKREGVITVGEARVIFKDAAAMKTALHFIQFAAGDRVEDQRMRNPNQTDSAKPGWRRVPDHEHKQIREIVYELVAAIRDPGIAMSLDDRIARKRAAEGKS